jgi:hypothetical protein
MGADRPTWVRGVFDIPGDRGFRCALVAIASLPVLPGCDSTAAMAGVGRECREALQRFEAASEAALPEVRRYGFCVSSNIGADDCEPAFRRLHDAQRDFSRAAAERSAQCGSAPLTRLP